MTSTRSTILLYNRVGACIGRWWRWGCHAILQFDVNVRFEVFQFMLEVGVAPRSSFCRVSTIMSLV